MLELFAISGLINAMTALMFGGLVIIKNWRERSNRVFFLMTMTLAVWGVGYWQWLSATDVNNALLWLYILSISSVLIPVLYFHWVVITLNCERAHRYLLAISYITVLSITFFSRSRLFVGPVHAKLFFPFWPDIGLLYAIYIFVIYTGLICYSIFLLLRARSKRSIDDSRGRINYILLGTFLGFGGGFTNFLLWFNIYLPPYGNFLVASFPFFLGYAALRHNLFSLKTMAAEILIFFILLVVLVEVFISQSVVEVALKAVFFLFVCAAGYLLLQSVYKEVAQREKIEQQEHALEIVNQQQESLLHFMSHEIKGYLTKSEAGFAAISQGDLGPVSPEIATMAGDALTDVRKGVRTVMDILDASNLKRGTVAYKKTVFDLKDTVRAVVQHLKPAIDEKHLAVDMSLAWEIPCTVNADEEKMRAHVVRNLVDNAIKYTPAGSIKVEVIRAGPVVRFTISDSGVGITDEDKKKLFTEGGHGKDSIKVNVHSTGYGLFIAKTIVEAHGGKIWAESDGPDKGSRFIFELPAA